MKEAEKPQWEPRDDQWINRSQQTPKMDGHRQMTMGLYPRSGAPGRKGRKWMGTVAQTQCQRQEQSGTLLHFHFPLKPRLWPVLGAGWIEQEISDARVMLTLSSQGKGERLGHDQTDVDQAVQQVISVSDSEQIQANFNWQEHIHKTS